VPWQANRWVPIIGAAVAGVVVVQFVPSTALAVWLQAGAAVLLGLVFGGWFARSAIPRRTPIET
jgi:hypothetical protein